jgi:probable HAF family extracellular repeat protein
MNSSRATVLALFQMAVFGTGEAACADTIQYSFTPIDVPYGTNLFGTHAQGINESGQIVGFFYDTAGKVHSFLDSGGSFTTFDVLGAAQTNAYDINNLGQIVGFYGSDRLHGFLYNGGSFTTIDVPGAQYSEAFGINNSGQIVGQTSTSGFLYTGGTFILINDPSATVFTGALGINDNGQIVGLYGMGDRNHAFLYNGGLFTTIDPPGTIFAGANAINDTGQIVGAFSDATGTHGFLYNGGFTTIDVPGALLTEVGGSTTAARLSEFSMMRPGPMASWVRL